MNTQNIKKKINKQERKNNVHRQIPNKFLWHKV